MIEISHTAEDSCLFGRPSSVDNPQRLETLRSTGLLDSPRLQSLDRITELAQEFTGSAAAIISLIDNDRQFFLSHTGLPNPTPEERSTGLDLSFCRHILTSGKPMEIEDATLDSRVKDCQALVNVQAYLGYPIIAQGQILGTFCIIHPVPHKWTQPERRIVCHSAEMVSIQIELRMELNRSYRLKRELEQSNRELKEFAQIAAHDLKEPLRGVNGCLQIAVSQLGDSAPQIAEFLELARSSASRMQELVTTLYSYCRLNDDPISQEELPVAPLVKEVLDDLRELIKEVGATVKIEADGNIRGNKVLLRQLFQNLIGNAAKFARPDTPPVVVVSREGDTFCVSDNGIGIAEEDLERVFEPFHRAKQNRKPGTGIGLAICRRVVEKHNGSIWIDSTPGEGSQFRFRLQP